MVGYFDVHSHYIPGPGVDDGAESEEMSENMLQVAYKEGIRTIICTPHYHIGYFTPEKERVEHQYYALKEYADKQLPGLKLHLGTEIRYNMEVLELLNEKKIFTLAGSSYILVEFSDEVDYAYMRDGIYELKSNGYRPIIAHMERLECIRKDRNKAIDLVEMGAYTQCNTDSIVGNHGLGVKGFCKYLMKQDILHFVGTDAHNMGKRKPMMKACADYIERKFSTAYKDALLQDNPSKLIRNEYI